MQESGDPPQRPDPPSDAPVIDSDEDLGRFGGGEPDLDGDRALLRVLGLVVLLGVMIAALLLPPISLLDRGGDGDGVVGSARQSLPALPRGLIALSALHDLQGATSAPPPYRLRVRLTEQTDDGQNMALYTFDAGGWRRLATASLVDGGRTAEGQVDSIPDAIAVLRRTAFARSLGLVIGAGEVPDAAAPGVAIVSVVAAAPVVAPEGAGASVRVEAGALEAALAAGRASVYLGVAAPAEEDAAALDAILATPELTAAHAVDVANAAIEAGASGVHIDYSTLAPEQREALTAFAVALAAALEPEGMGLVMSLPTPSAGVAGAYDWESLSAAADVLWLRGPEDPEAYYQLLEPALETLAGAGTEMDALWLVIDRRSHERAPGGAVQAISLLDALTTASIVRTQIEGVGIRPGDGVTVRGVNIDRTDAANSGIAWDETALAVGFSYAGRSVWMENRFSVAFRLDLAHRYGLGGVVVAPGAADGALPDIWAPVAGFVEDGSVRLELPYGPYLEPSWGPPSATFDGSGADGVAVWRAPEQIGIHEVRLVVSEGTVFVGQEMLLRVTADVERTAPAAGSTPAPSPTATPAPTPSPTATPTPTSSPTPSPTATPAPTSSPTATPAPTSSPTPSPTATPTPTPSPTPSPTPTPTPSGPPGPAGNG